MPQDGVQEPASYLFAPVFDHGESLAEIDSGMATLAVLLIDSDVNTALPAELVQFAEQLVLVHRPNID